MVGQNPTKVPTSPCPTLPSCGICPVHRKGDLGEGNIVTTPKTVTWDCDPHTKAKHQLLRGYLMAWFPILLSWSDVTYAEGFSGAGVYNGGEPGSPVIAYQQANAALASKPERNVTMVLAEAHMARMARLQEEMAKADRNNTRIRTEFARGECGEVLLDKLHAIKAFQGPIFAFLDSFGGPDIPYRLLPPIAKARSSEVLLTFAPSFLTRFGGKERHLDSGDAAFGGPHWRAVQDVASHEKFHFLMDAYRHTLRMAGFKHSLSFEMVDEGRHSLYLLYGTNSPKGVEKMKAAMWQVDPVYGIRYRDPRDPNQLLLDIKLEPDTGPLRAELMAWLAQKPDGVRLQDLRDYALMETVYKPGQVRAAVLRLLKHGKVERHGTGPISGDTWFRIPPPTTPSLFDEI